LLVYAARDHIVERRYGTRMYDALTRTGTKAVYLEIPWADHAFDEVFNGPSNQLALYHTERFLAWALDANNASSTPLNEKRRNVYPGIPTTLLLLCVPPLLRALCGSRFVWWLEMQGTSNPELPQDPFS
jgi:hypothetical protein